METVAVPAQYLATLTTRWNLYRNASAVTRPFYRQMVQSTLNACSAALERPTTPPEGWAFIVEPDTVSIYPGIQAGTPITLAYPVAE